MFGLYKPNINLKNMSNFNEFDILQLSLNQDID